jgi:nicotinamide-nucleotide amidase
MDMASNEPSVQIIAVGTELLSSDRLDTNSLLITEQLNALGLEVRRKLAVRDGMSDISQALLQALETSDIVIFSGGLGPTSDDLTREAVAETLSRPLYLDSDWVEGLKERYRRHGLRLTENNRRQAMVPEGATILGNARGTAPGLFLEEKGKLIFLLPGPPREQGPMLEEKVIPLIRKLRPTRTLYARQIRIAAMAESAVDARISPLYSDYEDIETAILCSPGIIDVHLKWTGEDEEATAFATLDELVVKIQDELGKAVFTVGSESLEETVGELLVGRGLELATAESCTGGWIGKILTDVPGSSAYYLGGVISYSDGLKHRLLGVNDSLLEEFGAVSSQVAEAMAVGICGATGADVGISVTGVAGPGGGTDEKPVGLVFFGLSINGKAQSRKYVLPGEREAIRLRSSRFVLDWLRRELL